MLAPPEAIDKEGLGESDGEGGAAPEEEEPAAPEVEQRLRRVEKEPAAPS